MLNTPILYFVNANIVVQCKNGINFPSLMPPFVVRCLRSFAFRYRFKAISTSSRTTANPKPHISISIAGLVSTRLAVTKCPPAPVHLGSLVYSREFSRSCRPCS